MSENLHIVLCILHSIKNYHSPSSIEHLLWFYAGTRDTAPRVNLTMISEILLAY